MKTCPYCAEEIQDAAIVCKHCGREIAPEAVAMVTQGLKQQLTTEPAPEPKPSTSGANHIQSTVESGPRPSEAPEDNADSLERKPLWKSALRFGAIVAGFYVVYEIIQFSQGSIGSTELQGNLLTGVTAIVVAGTALGFILVALWRWQRWAPIALIILVFSGVLLYGGWAAGDISLGALSPPANMNEASAIAVTQPISTSTPVPTKTPVPTETPWLTWTPWPTSTSSVGATLPSGTILGRPIEDYELRSFDDLGVKIGNAYFGAQGDHDLPKFAADVLANDRVAIDKAAQFFCDVAMLYGIGCDVMNELYEKLEENNNVGTKALGVTLVLSQYIYQCKSEGMMVAHVGILGNICPERNNEYRIQWVLLVLSPTD